MDNEIPVYEISLPEYTLDYQPDYEAVGGKLDKKIVEHFAGRHILERGLTAAAHPGKSLDELVEIIRTLGHDHYDPEREGLHYPAKERGVDIFAGDLGLVQEGLRAMYDPLECFYRDIGNRGALTRLDLILCYDADQLEEVVLADWNDSCMYRFKDPDDKPRALLGIIKIL